MIYDDGNGNLLNSSSLSSASIGEVIGYINYSHGIGVVTDTTLIDLLNTTSYILSWTGVSPIYETNYSCKVKDFEYNYTYNPTAIDASGNLKDNVSGSEFSPYITTVGLYNDESELLAVGKLGQPLRKSLHTDMVLKIVLDF